MHLASDLDRLHICSKKLGYREEETSLMREKSAIKPARPNLGSLNALCTWLLVTLRYHELKDLMKVHSNLLAARVYPKFSVAV
jgi:hypothetical protein